MPSLLPKDNLFKNIFEVRSILHSFGLLNSCLISQWDHQSAKRSSPKQIWYGLHENAWFHGNPLYDSGDRRDRPANSIISRVLLILEHYNLCQIKAKTHVFLPVVKFINNQISIFMSINENLKE